MCSIQSCLCAFFFPPRCFYQWKVCWRSKPWLSNRSVLPWSPPTSPPSPHIRATSLSPYPQTRRPLLASIKWLSRCRLWTGHREDQFTSCPSSEPLRRQSKKRRSLHAEHCTGSGVLNSVLSPPSAIYQIKASENLIWLLGIWNTNIAAALNEVSGIFLNVCRFNGAPGTNYTVTVTAHHSLVIFLSHQVPSCSQRILIWMTISANLQSHFFRGGIF